MERSEILSLLRTVVHPAKGEKSIVELGMVDSIETAEGRITVTLAFPKKPDPLKNYLTGAARAAIYREAPGGTEVEVRTIVKDPVPPSAKKNVNDLGLDQIAEVRHIVGIASGKGGVGKSTVAVNLAVALARLGYRVGLADADVYGPSVPMMTGTEGAVPEAYESDGKELIVPVEKFGVKWMSIGYFAQSGQALIWRGPMACSALKQMILQVEWGPLDFLLIDMPPGTGDIHISLVQDIPMEGAIIVTTPQSVALADVVKGVDLFRNKNIDRPIFGIVENMAWFTPEELPENKYYIFGRDGGVKMASELGLPLLGQIPIVESIRQGGDDGAPPALSSRPDGVAFVALASRLAEILG